MQLELTPRPRLCALVARMLFLVLAVLVVPASLARAQAVPAPSSEPPSPVGRWKTVDDATGKVKSIVQIREENGKLYGTIEELFDPPSLGSFAGTGAHGLQEITELMFLRQASNPPPMTVFWKNFPILNLEPKPLDNRVF